MPGSAAVWDVVRVDFRCADRDARASRPALVVATPAATGTFPILWVLMITSARHALWQNDVTISDPRAAGLPHPGIVRTAKIATIDTRLATSIGRLPEPDREAVRNCLRNHIDPLLAG